MIELEERAREDRRGGPAPSPAAKLSDVARALLESPSPASSSSVRAPSPSRANRDGLLDWDWDRDAESSEAPVEAAEEDDSRGPPPLRPAQQAADAQAAPSEEGPEEPEGPATTAGGTRPRPSPPGPAAATRSSPADLPAATSDQGAWDVRRPPSPTARVTGEESVSRLETSSAAIPAHAPAEAARGQDEPGQQGVPRTAPEPLGGSVEAATFEQRWWAPEVAEGDEAAEVMTERHYEAREESFELVEGWASADDGTTESYGEDAGADARTTSAAGSVHERLPRPAYQVDEHAYQEDGADWDEEDDDEDEEEDSGYALAPGRSMIEDPRRRVFYHRGSDDHHRGRRKRDPKRNPEGKPAFAHAGAALSAFIGLTLFIILLATISMIAGAAAIIKQDQGQPGNPPTSRSRLPRRGESSQGSRGPSPSPCPSRCTDAGAATCPGAPVPVPPVAPPVVPVVPGTKPPARRWADRARNRHRGGGPSRPPTRRGPSRPPSRRPPSRQPAKLPLCKNTYVTVEGSPDPDREVPPRAPARPRRRAWSVQAGFRRAGDGRRGPCQHHVVHETGEWSPNDSHPRCGRPQNEPDERVGVDRIDGRDGDVRGRVHRIRAADL